MSHAPRVPTLALALATALAAGTATAQEKTRGRFSMSKGVACKKIEGFRKYQPLRPVALTRDDKLLVYYEPRNFASEKVDGGYRAHLVQDGRIRRKDQKKVLRREDKAIDLSPKADEPITTIYMYTNASLKGLEPGEYELDIILHDEVNDGATATQTVAFRVVTAEEKKKLEKEAAEDQDEKSER